MAIIEDDGFVEFVRYITEDLGHLKSQRFADKLKGSSSFVDLIIQLLLVFGLLRTRSYISFTVHYDDDFYPKSWTLEVKELPGIHDGTAIATALTQMLEDWLLARDYCTRILIDSGSNVLKATDLRSLEHIPCIAHTLHPIVAGAMIKAKSNSPCDEVPTWVDADDETGILEHEEDELY
ncbi:Zinc finger BED domain containing hypothetical protein 4-like [Phytophthora palmivora]|uniref:Uncharacterized protein n=1 Tax=Phytophthora palmivora TaxID=4796 RepID=A0A2P4XGH8_9STRA|nr:Zinc finger BED domain containing hypothetical protein 4-like [Phytophthora palmivora]